MKKFKEDLSYELHRAINEIYPEGALILTQENDNGFFCDYAIPPIIPQIFSKIKDKIEKNRTGYYELSGFSGVYLDNDANKQVLQRIYIAAFETKQEYDDYKKYRSEAEACDHKLIGADLKLFSSSPEIGQGLNLWHPKGAMLRYLLENFGQKAHILNEYEWVYTPHIGKSDLWATSGHLDFYKDSMYSPIIIDEEEYYLKPMNCPFHINIYNSEIRSYRDLPIKYAEYGTVYRYELSGTLNGLTRVRGFTQDDAHIICTPEQVEQEIVKALKFSLYILRSFGLNDFRAYISTKPKTKFIGNDADWDMAEAVLKKAVAAADLDYAIDAGGGAFYGPKIDLKLNDSLNRQWECSTIQFDFNLPRRFNMYYIGSDGKKHLPFMIHRALFGSLERFIALLIEHYKGEFPFWFTPVQFGIVPIAETHNAYAEKVKRQLLCKDFRVRVDSGKENMRNKIKKFENEKIPYILVVGDKETENETFSLRSRKSGNMGNFTIMQLCTLLKPDIEIGIPKPMSE